MDTPQWYLLPNADEIDSPALVVYKDRVVKNIRACIAKVSSPSLLRPHVKTNKMAEVCLLMLAEGITKFKCATIAEAEMLGSVGAPDVLLAYQPVGPKIARLLELQRQFPATIFSCLVDSFTAAQQISGATHAVSFRLPVFIDLNVGMNRTGIIPSEALRFAQSVSSLPGIHIIGLHAYDGHIADDDVATRTKRSEEAFKEVPALVRDLNGLFNTPMIIVAGGSPTFSYYAKRGDVECSPGTFVFWDMSYSTMMPEEPFEPAVLVLTRIVSIVDNERLCLDLGHKSLSADHLQPRVHFLNAQEAVPVSHSEEHLVVKVPDTSKYTVGELFYGVPKHICPTVALYERAIIAEGNNAVGEWEVTARDKKIKW